MNGIVLGMAMLAGLPAVEVPRVAPVAFTFNLPDAAATSLRTALSPEGHPSAGTADKASLAGWIFRWPRRPCARRDRTSAHSDAHPTSGPLVAPVRVAGDPEVFAELLNGQHRRWSRNPDDVPRGRLSKDVSLEGLNRG